VLTATEVLVLREDGAELGLEQRGRIGEIGHAPVQDEETSLEDAEVRERELLDGVAASMRPKFREGKRVRVRQPWSSAAGHKRSIPSWYVSIAAGEHD
jgi:hypothetical protein